MILVVGGIKGGCGKTTLATNLCVLRSQNGKRVLLVDADEQRSAFDWSEHRLSFGVETNWTTVKLSGKSTHKQIDDLSKSYDDVIVDVGGKESFAQRSALTIANKFLVPFRPKSLDVWTMGKVCEIISEVKVINPNLNCYAVINQADCNGSDNVGAYDAISECSELECFSFFIGYRKAFSSAAAQGLAVSEIKPLDKKALQEINSLYAMVFS